MNYRIFDYFNIVAKRLSLEYKLTGTGKNSSDIGYNREMLLEKFLINHIPYRLKAYLGGHIFGVGEKNESKQIDLILANDIGLNFKEHSKMFTAVENVAAAFSIKSSLNKKELIDCLENLASIPQINKEVIKFKFIKESIIDDFIKYHPTLFIFAFKGASLENTMKTLEEFYKNKEIPFNRYPTMIIVNERYYISFTPNKTNKVGGGNIPSYIFNPVKLDETICGIPFFNLLNSLSEYQDWLSKMTIDYKVYFNDFLKTLYEDAV